MYVPVLTDLGRLVLKEKVTFITLHEIMGIFVHTQKVDHGFGNEVLHKHVNS